MPTKNYQNLKRFILNLYAKTPSPTPTTITNYVTIYNPISYTPFSFRRPLSPQLPTSHSLTFPPGLPIEAETKNSKELERIDNLFRSFANAGLTDPYGIETLCADIEVAPTDVRILMLAWCIKAEKHGYFTLDEWRKGLKDPRAEALSKLKKGLAYLEQEDNQKCVDIESICDLLPLVLGPKFPAQVDSFIEYLKVQNEYKVLNLDQWKAFLRFCNDVVFLSLLFC